MFYGDSTYWGLMTNLQKKKGYIDRQHGHLYMAIISVSLSLSMALSRANKIKNLILSCGIQNQTCICIKIKQKSANLPAKLHAGYKIQKSSVIVLLLTSTFRCTNLFYIIAITLYKITNLRSTGWVPPWLLRDTKIYNVLYSSLPPADRKSFLLHSWKRENNIISRADIM